MAPQLKDYVVHRSDWCHPASGNTCLSKIYIPGATCDLNAHKPNRRSANTSTGKRILVSALAHFPPLESTRSGASMVFPGEHCRITTPIRVRNMRGGTEQGAVLHSPAIRLGRHHVCIYTTKAGCAICGGLLRKMQPCVHQAKLDGAGQVGH